MNGPGERLEQIALWPQFTGDEWQLPHALDQVDRLLVGWRVVPATVDAEVPAVVATLLIQVLGQHASLVFASALRPPAAEPLLGRRWRLNRDFVWKSATGDEEATQGIFFSDSFPWCRQGQVVLFSPKSSSLALAEEVLDLPDDPALFHRLAKTKAGGAMLPGVDGQVAGLYFFDEGLAGAVADDLEKAARAAGAACHRCTGDEFRLAIKG